jgi:AcrR family transcriptional regulator
MPVRPPKPARRAPRTAATEPGSVRDRILAAFSAKAKRAGIRAVVMGELASELRMSAMTLYKHFASKDDLVAAMVDAWALELAAIDSLDWSKVDDCRSALAMLLAWADAWTAILGRVAPAFFRDLRRDHPESFDRFHALIDDRKQTAAGHLMPYIRPDVHPWAMLLMLEQLVMYAVDPRFVERLGLSRREGVRAALALWGGGALVEPTMLPESPPPEALRFR